ncbi:Ppx/GppA phosphatase family protein [Labrys wisconsinensis]|uniref:Exopolyphosphatase/guanosine-5'-triphosphate, 3'-diphosphate pyrophosphatase n=1 Tax=Labrys wisconsinensis TaxID=425677 RepID=A0ABU0J2D8_9HYPH|nr:exopolyphosphatase/guanosine-5'-triphosphate,3'-diphosphate pyrophosphatase [Labrys wisconsinensis]
MERGLEAEAAWAPGHAAVTAAPEERRPAQPVRREHTYAAIDLGTNNCRLLVARPAGDGFRVIDAFSRIVRLGEGLSHSGRLNEGAMGRAIEALGVCAQKMRDRRVDRARLIATEACRAAANGAAFIERVGRETGLELEIVSRETEARLAAAGCVPLIDRRTEGVVLFDIGGGSSELVWLGFEGTGGRRTPAMRGWISLPVGVVTLSERHGGVRVTRRGFEAMVEDVAAMLECFEHKQAIAGQVDRLHMLGTSGTVTTMAGIHLRLPRYDRRRVDGLWMSAGELDSVLEELLGMSFEDRVANACIGPERADLVLAGCAILEAIRRAFPCERLRVADRGLREGLLVEMMEQDGVWRRGDARS